MKLDTTSRGGRLDARRYPSPVAAWSAIALLFVVYACSFVDRQIMSMMVRPIRADLHISDTGISLLQGLAFALFYAFLGAPIGRLVDSADRPRVLAVGIAAWSLFTCLCGRASSFWTLFLARLGVGVGEATVNPATYSLIADYFPPDRRGLPMGVFGSGVYVGMGLALLLGGALIRLLTDVGPIDVPVLGAFAPWQVAFVCAGLPGLLLAGLVLFLREPREHADARRDVAGPPSLRAALRYVADNRRAIASHHLATALLAMALYSMLAWAPEYFRRSFGLDPARAGLTIGGTVAVCGTLGVILSGVLSDRLLARGIASARMLVTALAGILACPTGLAFALAPSLDFATFWMGATVFLVATLTVCGPTGAQDLYPARLRGMGSALMSFVVTLLGLGVGPTCVAAIGDYLLRDEAKLYQALALTLPVMTAGAAIVALTGRTAFARCAAANAAADMV